MAASGAIVALVVRAWWAGRADKREQANSKLNDARWDAYNAKQQAEANQKAIEVLRERSHIAKGDHERLLRRVLEIEDPKAKEIEA